MFGNTTVLETQLLISEDRQQVTLTNSRVSSGAFVLNGAGTIQRENTHAAIQMRMSGSIPCTSLASSAAVARLGDTAGRLLGSLAKRTLAGSVRVSASIKADTRSLASAQVTHDVELGCTVSFL
jgi:hypothetical protein